MKVGFIGLGNMGAPMAARLVAAGHAVRVHNRSRGPVERLVALGASAADSAGDAAAGADAVVTMLPAGAQVREVCLAPGGVLERAPRGALLIDSSTIDPATAREVASAAAARGLEMLDAPVSGGVGGATNGTLTFMVGGSASALERARPLFAAMGRNIFHAGPGGAGQMAKLCNNLLLGVIMAGTAEALRLGAAGGLDPRVLSEIIRQSSGGNWVLNSYNPCPGVMENVPAARGYSGGFAAELMQKDLSLAVAAAGGARAAVPMGEKALALYAAHVASGGGKLDFSSIYRHGEPPERGGKA